MSTATAPRPWSKKDLQIMRSCAKRKMSARETAGLLGRTRGAVAFKAMKIGCSFRAIRQPAGVQRRRFRKRARKAA